MSNQILIGFEQSTVTNDIRDNILSAGQQVSILSPDLFLDNYFDSGDVFLVTVLLDKYLRQQCIDKLNKDQLPRFSFVHSTAILNSSAVVKPGTYIGPFSSVYYRAVIAEDCIIGPYCLIGHKTSVGTNCIMNPNAMIAGSSTIGNNCYLGARSTIIDKVTICDNVRIGAGSMVTKTITESGFYLGSPARKSLTKPESPTIIQ